MPGNIHEIPASVTKSWPAPNYVDPTRRTWMPTLCAVLLTASTILVASRLLLRITRRAGVAGLDDVLALTGWLFGVGVVAVVLIDASLYKLDVHTWDVMKWIWPHAAMMAWIIQILFLTSTCATKASVLLFYRRLVKNAQVKHWIWAIWGALAFTGAYFLVVLILYFCICTPLDAYWLSYTPEYTKTYQCLDGNVMNLFVGVLSVVSDVYSVLLPCLVVRSLEITERQKTALNLLFGLSISVVVAGCMRTYHLWRVNHTYDISWAVFDLFVWSVVECHLALICSNLPIVRAVYRTYMKPTVESHMPHKGEFSESCTNRRRQGYQDIDMDTRSKISLDELPK